MELVQSDQDAGHVCVDVHELDRPWDGRNLQRRAGSLRRPDRDCRTQRGVLCKLYSYLTSRETKTRSFSRK